jgi:ubiquinone/menaquinone biosynthesis C-methylase UbiE
MTLPVTTPSFWKKRIYSAFATGKDLHTCIYQIDYRVWRRIQTNTAKVLTKHLRSGDSLLDAGCGYGALFECLNDSSYPTLHKVKYTGVDLSPDLIELGNIRNPKANLICHDLSQPLFDDNTFDFAIMRSVEGMMHDNKQETMYSGMLEQLMRVAKKIIVMEYGDIEGYKILQKDK